MIDEKKGAIRMNRPLYQWKTNTRKAFSAKYERM